MMRFQPPGAPVHGAALHTDRAWDLWLPAKQFDAQEGTPDFAAARGSTANAYEKFAAWALDQTVDEGVVAIEELPAHWVSGSVTAKIYWCPTSANTGPVVLQVIAAALSAGAQLDKAFDMAPFSSFTPGGVAEDLNVGSLTLGTPSSRLLRLHVRRAGSNAGDTYTADVWFIGLLLEFTVDE
jgi:hypothetical protein